MFCKPERAYKIVTHQTNIFNLINVILCRRLYCLKEQNIAMKHLYISFLILLSQVYGTWGGWWFSSNNEETHDPLKTQMISSAVGAEFSIRTLDNDEKGMNLVESAKLVMLTSKSCSLNAYQDLSTGCSKIVAEEELRYKLAWDLSDCFQQHTDGWLSLGVI